MFTKESFAFLSKSERKKRGEDYLNRIYQLGEGHKELVVQRLALLIKEKRTDKEKLFAYVSVKDIYTAQPDKRREALTAWFNKAYYLPSDKERIIALVVLDSAAANLEEYPSLLKVEQLAEQYQAYY